MILDESLDLQDLGVSGFKGRNIEKGALGRFIEACKQGRVKTGSALVVESLDRLTRQTPRKAVALLTQLLDDYGIDVHVTSMDKVFKPDSKDEGIDLILAVAIAIRANEESETKSKRLQEVWANKRKLALETKAFMRLDLPWWLIEKNGKIVCPPEKGLVVKEAFRLTADGFSSAQVARQLNERARPTWRLQSRWTSARVRDLVRSKGPQGILQATRKTVVAGRDYQLPGYYPVVVSDALAATARNVLLRNTRGNRGRTSEGDRPLNIFRGILRYQGRWMRHSSHQNGTPDLKTGRKTWNGYYECFDELGDATKGKMLFCISAKQLEPVVFAGLAELQATDFISSESNSELLKLANFNSEILGLEEKIDNLLLAVESGSTSVASRLREVEHELVLKQKQRDQMKGLLTPIRVQPKEFKTSIQNLNSPEMRQRAAISLRRLVTRIDVGRTFEELPITDDLRKKFVRQRSAITTNADVFSDPINNDKRRKPLHIMITFASGIARYICRLENTGGRLISWRVEAEDVSG